VQTSWGMMMMGPGAAAAPAEEVEEQTEFDDSEDVPADKKIAIGRWWTLTGLG